MLRRHGVHSPSASSSVAPRGGGRPSGTNPGAPPSWTATRPARQQSQSLCPAQPRLHGNAGPAPVSFRPRTLAGPPGPVPPLGSSPLQPHSYPCARPLLRSPAHSTYQRPGMIWRQWLKTQCGPLTLLNSDSAHLGRAGAQGSPPVQEVTSITALAQEPRCSQRRRVAHRRLFEEW